MRFPCWVKTHIYLNGIDLSVTKTVFGQGALYRLKKVFWFVEVGYCV